MSISTIDQMTYSDSVIVTNYHRILLPAAVGSSRKISRPKSQIFFSRVGGDDNRTKRRGKSGHTVLVVWLET